MRTSGYKLQNLSKKSPPSNDTDKRDSNIHVIDEEDKLDSPDDRLKKLVTGNEPENVDDTRGQTLGEEFSPIKIEVDQSKDVIDKELSVEQQSPV